MRSPDFYSLVGTKTTRPEPNVTAVERRATVDRVRMAGQNRTFGPPRRGMVCGALDDGCMAEEGRAMTKRAVSTGSSMMPADPAARPNQTITVLVISTHASSLRVVVRNPAVQLRVLITRLGQAGSRCAVDGRPVMDRPNPRDMGAAINLVADLLRMRGIEVDAVAHRVRHLPANHFVPQPIDDALTTTAAALLDLPAVSMARATWPDSAHFACFGDDDAAVDRQARELLRRAQRQRTHTVAAHDRDDRADLMLADPRGYFAEARERARAEVAHDVATALRRAHR
jgi:hypothetical protein